MNALQALFAEKLIIDDRLPFFSFTLSDALGGKSFGILMPKSAFYVQLIIMLTIQTIIAAIMAIVIYQFIILPQRGAKATTTTGLNVSSLLIGFGAILPMTFYEPIWIIDYLRIQSTSMKTTIMALPLNLSLQCLEAMFGGTPEGPKKNIAHYIIYGSCLTGSKFDSTTQKPLRVTRSSFCSVLKEFSFSMAVTCVLTSLLDSSNFAPFETKATVGFDHSYDLTDLFSVGHLMNNFAMALLVSITLSLSTIGVGFFYNICYRVQTVKVVHNPMFTSKSPSDFWGRKWNMQIHSTLKRSIFKPARKYFSKKIAVAATFFVSGLLHEYVVLIFYRDATLTPSYGKNMIFFGWNGVLILLESIVGRLAIFQWMGKRLPGPLISVLVVLTALPFAHWFLQDWIAIGYFQHFQLGIPMIVALRH